MLQSAMDSFTFKIFVQNGINVVEVGECDVDHISLITLVHAICEKLSGNSDVPTEDYHVWAQIPWSDCKYGVGNDSELLELFSMFEDRGLDKLNYEGDSEKDDEEGDEDNTRFRKVPIVEEGTVEEESVDGDVGITQDSMDGSEGYQSKSDNQYFTDSELEPEQVRIARLVKGNPFKRMVDGLISFHIGQIFNSKEHMREVIKECVIQEGIELKRVKNDRVRQTYECTEDRCGWRAHGSCMIDGVTFMIKTLCDQHDCHRTYNNNEAKVKWIASKFEKLVKSNPSIDVKVIGDLLRENYKVSVDMHKLYRAKHRALQELANEHANCFGYLRRSFIGVDGCHLKSPFGGVLLSAVSLDANSGLFPLAICIGEKETQESWEWFLYNLKVFLNYPTNRNLTFMSDRQKGVIAALQIHFPFAHRRYCARHIYANFKLTFKGDHYKKLFWRATRSSNIYDFKSLIEEICIINPTAKKWLEEIDPQHWSRFAYDHVIKCDHVTNNMTGAFNSMLGTHRAASYLDLLEFIRRMVMRKFNERKDECIGWSSVLPPRVQAKILSRSFKMIAAWNMEYELLGASGGYAVKIREYNRQCGSWQVSGIPCCHVMAAISHYCGRAAVKDKVVEFVHSSLTKSAYMQTYVGMIHPIPDQKRWPEVPTCILIPGHTKHIDSPTRIVQPGRLKKLRNRESDEAPKVGRSGTVVCKLCQQAGHNKRSCQRRKDNQTAGASVGASSSHEPNQTPHPQSQVTQQLFD
ncbi:hypothetical protein EZV62_011413 [Acer yangbiense]|uniref:Zinc finger PMZ-type domain-containing protein n=1 Tax=Acer yangbiense TaxID=1000413 RepID=A0A5C7I6I6_9ROSI|nr:hypothetical protein EZV62_011413 [Acer yangbiense]